MQTLWKIEGNLKYYVKKTQEHAWSNIIMNVNILEGEDWFYIWLESKEKKVFNCISGEQ